MDFVQGIAHQLWALPLDEKGAVRIGVLCTCRIAPTRQHWAVWPVRTSRNHSYETHFVVIHTAFCRTAGTALARNARNAVQRAQPQGSTGIHRDPQGAFHKTWLCQRSKCACPAQLLLMPRPQPQPVSCVLQDSPEPSDLFRLKIRFKDIQRFKYFETWILEWYWDDISTT